MLKLERMDDVGKSGYRVEILSEQKRAREERPRKKTIKRRFLTESP